MWLLGGISHDSSMWEAAAGAATLVLGLHNEILSKEKQGCSSNPWKLPYKAGFLGAPHDDSHLLSLNFSSAVLYTFSLDCPVLDCRVATMQVL